MLLLVFSFVRPPNVCEIVLFALLFMEKLPLSLENRLLIVE